MKNWLMVGFVIPMPCLYHIVSWLIYIYIVIFVNFSLFESRFCTLSKVQIDGSWFHHQSLWVLLMVLI